MAVHTYTVICVKDVWKEHGNIANNVINAV